MKMFDDSAAGSANISITDSGSTAIGVGIADSDMTAAGAPVTIFLQALNASGVGFGTLFSVVVIFGENISFDHYFGTYPTAVNPPGEPRFLAHPGTPVANTLATPNAPWSNLLTANPNLNPANGAGAANPFRLNRVLEHEDNEMMRPYEVVAAGAPAKR